MAATATRDQINTFRLQPGDVIITKDSETADDIGVPALVESSAPDLICGYHLALLRPRRQQVDPRFLFWSMAADPAREQLAVAATGVTRFGLRAESISKLTLTLPTLPRQRAIAGYLDADTAHIDSLIKLRARLHAVLRERRTATTASGVSGLLNQGGNRRCPDLPWLEHIPAHWRTAKLGLVAKMGSGHTPSRERPEWWTDCTIPWITTGEVAQLRDDRVEFIAGTRERISEVGLDNSSAVLHPAGTVVLSRTASAGFSAIMGVDMATSQDYVTWTCCELLEPRFLLLCLRAMRRDLLERLAQGSTHKTIYMPDIETIRIPLPPLTEQRAIVESTWHQLRAIDRTLDAIIREIGVLRERRQALITAAVTGQLDIPGAA